MVWDHHDIQQHVQVQIAVSVHGHRYWVGYMYGGRWWGRDSQGVGAGLIYI